jgi:hypothetical protein
LNGFLVNNFGGLYGQAQCLEYSISSLWVCLCVVLRFVILNSSLVEHLWYYFTLNSSLL